MKTKRNLFVFALGGAAGFILGRYPREALEKARGVAGAGVGVARDRVGPAAAAKLPLNRTGGHRAATAQAPGSDGVINGTSPYASKAHP
ncbi:hypothetical protein FB381_3023 [Nocardioides albertanoniae]|uniref:Uncharacterized protein n=1 Tax=Nocardioides albertanoniae TaxID=1175486 RepID=A0A543A956_9ACTN|nr:hypothetical protein [Nocardioides albertanoniae]TQL69121.1 hypothetical protein FB381_3023 [Nocardioides albertanoniae]